MDQTVESSLTETFASFADGFRLKHAPAAIPAYARLLVMDLLGCAIGGLGTPEAGAALKACLHMDGTGGKVPLWGTGHRSTPRSAALFNGIISHVLELDDFLGIDHSGAVVVPALFAVMAQEDDYDEPRFLEAMILGYELGRRMLDAGGGYAKHNAAGWHTTGTLGAYAAAAACSKYLHLSQTHTVSALGLAGSVAGGTWAFSTDGSMSKRFHPGVATQNGITAAYLAREGFTGPRHVLGAEWGGYFNQFASNHEFEPAALFADLGDDLRLGWAGIKPYACCRGCHSVIDAMHQLRAEQGLQADDVDSILVICSPGQKCQLGNIAPRTAAEAQLSLPFAAATALQFDTLGTGRFIGDALQDLKTRTLAAKVSFEVRQGWPFGKEPEFHVTLTDGRLFTVHVPAAKGDPRNPVPVPQALEKFYELTLARLPADAQQAIAAFGLSDPDRAGLQDIAQVLAQNMIAQPYE